MSDPKNGRSDPSANVRELSEASSRRQDDLREAADKLQSSEIKRLEEAIQCVKEENNLQYEHFKEMRVSEAARLDSIRQVDVTAVRTEATRALEAIQTLAATSARDAETLRTALVNTAGTIATQTAETVKQILERIAALERSSYEGVGKQRVADPALEKLVTRMESLLETRATSAGKDAGIGLSWGVLLGIGALAVAAVGIMTFTLANRTPAVGPQPQVIYMPAPAPAAR